MAFNNYLKQGLDNRPTWNTPGSKRLMFVKSDVIQGLSYDTPDYIDDVYLRVGEKWNLFSDLDNLSYQLMPDISKNGTLYGVEISFTVNVQTRTKNELFDSLRNTDLTAIIQDRNNRWWLVGLEQPLRLTSQEQKIDNDTNQYTIKISTRQRDNVKEMSNVFKYGLNENNFNPSLDSVDGFTLDVKIATTNGNSGGNGGNTNPGQGLPNHFQTTITSPPSGYVVLDTIGVVFASPGTTIKLPAAGVNGQQHVVKDVAGSASLATITVDGNGKSIDGQSQFKINTDFGAAQFTYNNNAWLVSAYVN